MPHDPKITGVTFENGRFYIEQYEAPADVDADGNYVSIEDEYKEPDSRLRKSMLLWLDEHFPMGGNWETCADTRQGIAWFNIPKLMGSDFVWRINLRKSNDMPMEMHRGAGEICERYNLARGRWDLDCFLAAREKHSRLIMPWKPVPG